MKRRQRGRGQLAVAAKRVRQQDRKGAFIHLDAVPVGRSVEPCILRPMAVGLLDGAEIGQYLQRVGGRTGGQKAACRLDQVARPHQMIAAEVLVAFAETPWDRQACDGRSRKAERAVRGKNGRADAIGIRSGLGLAIERQQLLLPVAPAGDIRRCGSVEAGRQAGARIVGGFLRARTEGQREQRPWHRHPKSRSRRSARHCRFRRAGNRDRDGLPC